MYSFSSTDISWRSVKQTMSVIQHIRESCGISSGHEAPTVVHENSASYIAQRTATSKVTEASIFYRSSFSPMITEEWLYYCP